MNKCIYCEKEINNKGSLISHQNQCLNNPDRVPRKRSPNAGLKKGNIPWNKGLTADTDERVDRSRITLKESYASGKIIYTFRKHTQETKQKLSKIKKELYMSGWEPTCGRCKNMITFRRLKELSKLMVLGN